MLKNCVKKYLHSEEVGKKVFPELHLKIFSCQKRNINLIFSSAYKVFTLKIVEEEFFSLIS